MQQLIVIPIVLLVDQMQRVAVPALARVRNEGVRLQRGYALGQLAVLLVSCCIFGIVIGVGDHLIGVLLGADWAFAGTAFQLLAIGGVFRALFHTLQWLFIGAGQTGAAVRASLWTQPLVVALTMAGLPFGLAGLAICNSLAWFMCWIIATAIACRSARIPARKIYWDAVLCILAVAAPVCLLSMVFGHFLGSSAFEALLWGILGGSMAALVSGILVTPLRRRITILLAHFNIGVLARKGGVR